MARFIEFLHLILIKLKTGDPDAASDEKNDTFSIQQNISHQTWTLYYLCNDRLIHYAGLHTT